MFLSDFNIIFDTRESDIVSRDIEIVATAPEMTPEDIRSPRRQLFQDLPTPAYNQPSFPKTGPAAPSTSSGAHSSGLLPGFTPLQPSHEPPRFGQYLFAQGQGPPITVNAGAPGGSGGGHGGEYASLNGSLALPSNDRDVKAKRRESSLLMMMMDGGKPAPRMG